MKRLSLRVEGGGHLEFHGDQAAHRVLLIVGRERYFRDEPLVQRLIAHFVGRGLTVVRYESRDAEFRRRMESPFLNALPRPVRKLVRGVWVAALPDFWRYYEPASRARIPGILERARGLRAAIESLGPDREVIVFARSIGARLASLIADATNVERVAAVGYPFQHPDEGPDEERYRHLADVRTPMLIIQGSHDQYGGSEIAGRYALGRATTLEFVDGDHELQLDQAAQERLLRRLDGFFLGS